MGIPEILGILSDNLQKITQKCLEVKWVKVAGRAGRMATNDVLWAGAIFTQKSLEVKWVKRLRIAVMFSSR